MSNQVKQIRGQVRQIVKEIIDDVLRTELVETARKEVATAMNARLDTIEKFCQGQLEKQDKRAKNIQAFLTREVTYGLQNDKHNMWVTMLAWQEVMAERLGIPEELGALIDARKKIVHARLEKEAEERMKQVVAPDAPANTEKPAEEENKQAEQGNAPVEATQQS